MIESKSNPFDAPRPPRRFQFSLRALFGLTTACAVLAGVFKWLGLTPFVSGLLALLLVGSFCAAFLLIATIARRLDDGDKLDD